MRFRALFAAAAIGAASPAAAGSRIKDIVDVENVRSNQLVGYGLVVGLAGTGDRTRNAPFTEESTQAMLERMGVNVRGSQMPTQNIAAVTVTATMPPFARAGSKIDVLWARRITAVAPFFRRRPREPGRFYPCVMPSSNQRFSSAGR